MSATYDKIQATTLGSAQATVTFATISGSYTDLILIINSRSASTSRGVSIQFNNDTGSNYSVTRLIGNGSAASSSRATGQTYIEIGDQNISTDTAGNIGNIICYIQNYSNSTTNKTTLSRTNIANVSVRAISGLWRNTNAITEIDIISSGGNNFNAGSTFTLYGIKAE
jgi:translation initiation factor RLI1